MELGIDDLGPGTAVGAGGFGTVYRSHEASLHRDVAVKVLPPVTGDEVAEVRLSRELRALGLLSRHPNIVTVYRTGTTAEGRRYIVMELVEGGSVADLLARAGPLPWVEAMDAGVRLCGALETAHRAGVLHRDIKPENVLRSEYGEPLLCDFGIARLAGATESRAGLTGSIAHVAPELLSGRPPSPSADLYALGSTLYTLLAGTPAFLRPDDTSAAAVFARILHEAPPDLRPRGIPGPVADAIELLLAKSPESRPASAAAAGEMLRTTQRALGREPTAMVLASLPLPEGPIDDQRTVRIDEVGWQTPGGASDERAAADTGERLHTTTEPRREARRWRLVTTLLLVAVVGGGLALAGLARSREEPSPPAPGGTIAVASSGATAPAASSSTSAVAPQAAGGGACDLVAETGAEEGDGSPGRPYGSVQALVDALGPGITGCLLAGRYEEAVTIAQAGEPGAPAVITSAEGGDAELVGSIDTVEGADHLQLRNLTIVANRVPGVRIFGGTGIELIGNDLSSRLGTCVYVAEVVPTTSLTVERNRIHDCGERSGSPNLFGLSIGNADTVRIAGNVFFGIRDAGVVGYPQLDNAVITGNTFVDIRIPIDVGGTSDDLASGNITVERNVLAGQSEQHLKTSFEADVSPGERNLVARRNCLEPGSSISGLFREEDNDLASAVFVDPAAEDYRQAPGSPCLGRGADLPPPTPGG